MSLMRNLSNLSRLIIVMLSLTLFLGFFFALGVIRRDKESVDMLEQLKFPPYLSFDCPFTTGLYWTIYKRELSLLRDSSDNLVKLNVAFQRLQEAGKATTEEVETIKEFEKALNNLSRAIQKIDSISSLRREMRL